MEDKKDITQDYKIKLYWAMVLPVLMYGSECWTLRKEDDRRLPGSRNGMEGSEVKAEDKESEMRRRENLEQRKR